MQNHQKFKLFIGRIYSSKYDFQVVDLNSVFRNDWQKNRKAFDFGAFDSHWNAYAHNLVASFTAPSLDTKN